MSELYRGLEDHISSFSPWGAHRVGQLTERTREYVAMLIDHPEAERVLPVLGRAGALADEGVSA